MIRPTLLEEKPALHLEVIDPPADTAVVPEANTGDNVRASWNFSLHQLRANIAHCSPEGKEALVAAFLWCIDPMHPVHRKEFSRRVDYNENTIWKIFQGKYRSPDGNTLLDVPKPLIKGIRDFLKLERERYGGGKTEFVETPTSKRIFTICDLARESQTPAFVWGHSHCGKTWAGRNYVAQNNHGRSVYCRVPSASGLGGLVRAIATSVGVSDKGNTANLTGYIKKAVTSDMLLFLDEVHQLAYTYRKASFFAALEVIREIYDETQCGMVLCGTSLMMDQIRGARHAELEQLFNRGTHRLNLMSAPTVADLTAILKHWGLEVPDKKLVLTVVDKTEHDEEVKDAPYEVLRQLATTVRLKAITERLRYARKIAKKAKADLNWTHFLLAHHMIANQANDDKGGWE
jgi:DNA transposition AAA+ family ATPase